MKSLREYTAIPCRHGRWGKSSSIRCPGGTGGNSYVAASGFATRVKLPPSGMKSARINDLADPVVESDKRAVRQCKDGPGPAPEKSRLNRFRECRQRVAKGRANFNLGQTSFLPMPAQVRIPLLRENRGGPDRPPPGVNATTSGDVTESG